MTKPSSKININAVSIFAGQLFANSSMFIFYIIISKEFGPDGVGQFTLGLMISSVLATVAGLGFKDGLTNFISKYRTQNNQDRIGLIVYTSIAILFLISSLITVVVATNSEFISAQIFSDNVSADVLEIFSLSIPAVVLAGALGGIYLGYEAAHLKVIFEQLIPRLLLVLFTVALLSVGTSMLELSLVYTASTWVSVIVGIFIMSIFFTRIPHGLDKGFHSIIELSIYSIPLLFSATITRFLTWTDTFLIGVLLTSGDVGIYQTSYLLGSNIMIFLGAVAPSLFPVFRSKLEDGLITDVRDLYLQYARGVALVTIPVGTYLIIFSSNSLKVLYGEAFTGGSTILVLVVAGNLVSVLVGPTRSMHKSLENTTNILKSDTIAFISNVFLNIIFIPTIGLIGAAVATAISSGMKDIYLHLLTDDDVRVKLPIQEYVISLLIAIVSAFPFYLTIALVNSIPLLIVHSMLYAVFYTLMMFISGTISRHELQSLKHEISTLI